MFLGIAAGNGRGSFSPHLAIPYAGIAPDATLLVVRTNFTEPASCWVGLMCSSMPDRLEMPSVIRFESRQYHFGPHGARLFEISSLPFSRAGSSDCRRGSTTEIGPCMGGSAYG